MAAIRSISKVLHSVPTLEGAGVRLWRAFGYAQVPQFDPFLLLDDFHSDDPEDYVRGFPWHPHRGIETITYMLHGRVEHGDSLGNRGVIASGDVQWMTAGSGIVHQEMPLGDEDGLMWGFQLWANLPAKDKMMAPRYREVLSAEIPVLTLDSGVDVRVIAGDAGGVRGPVRDIVTDPHYLDVTLSPGARFSHAVPAGHTALAYVIAGRGCFDPSRDPYAYPVESASYVELQRDCELGPRSVVLYDVAGDELAITAGDEGARFLLISGRPIGEPVAWYGPIVMNTQDELRTALAEYQRGTFLRHRSPGD